jgi:CheY-like chemotaxis protein
VFFRRLIEDELTEPVHSILVGNFLDPNQPHDLTLLGATRVLKKPVSNDTLRRTIEELTESPLPTNDAQRPLGDLTVRGLAARLTEELEKGLTQATVPGTQATHVAFGDGTDVLAAVWGTVTRVRELVTLRSHGAVRFEATGPEGGIPLSPWIEAERRGGERGAKRGRDELGVSLAGRTVLVADDDPAIAWFLSGLLKTVGAEVIEAYDGERALAVARARWPDLVISDIMMPKLDGFALCREIKRDVAVRDIPVILLSWKEDLLQRMRELGADADGYLKKEAEASTVVQRIREVMRPRARVEARVRQGGEVRGRLDGLTPRLILELCCSSNENLRVEFRDAFFVYSLQVRHGRLVSAKRQAAAGADLMGAPVVRSVLGVNAGRFLVVPDTSAVLPEFEGSLRDVLSPAIEQARRNLWLLSHQRLASVERVELVLEELEIYLSATPEPAQTMLRLIAEGARPRDLLLGGAAPPELVIQALADLARRGVVERVVRAGGASEPPPPELEPEPEPEPAGSRRRYASVASPVRVEPSESRAAESPSSPVTGLPELSSSPVEESSMNPPDTTQRVQPTEPPAFSFQLSPEPPISRRPPENDAVDAAWFQESEEEAGSDVVAEALTDAATRTPPPAVAEPRAHELRAPTLPRPITIDDPLTEPPAAVTPTSGHQLSHLITAFSEEPAPVAQLDAPAPAPGLLPKTKPLTFPGDMRPLAEPLAHDVPARAEAKREPLPARESPREERRPADEPRPAPHKAAAVFESAPPEAPSSAEEPVAAQEHQAPVKDTSTFKVIGYALVAMAFSYIGMSALVAWLSDSGTDQPQTAPMATTAQAALTDSESAVEPSAEAEAAPAPTDAESAPAVPPKVESPAKEQVAVEDLPVPAGLALGGDKGVLKIVTSDAHTLYVDGEFAGRGPVRIVPLAPGKHTIKIRFDGAEKSYDANVQAGRMTRLTISVAK